MPENKTVSDRMNALGGRITTLEGRVDERFTTLESRVNDVDKQVAVSSELLGELRDVIKDFSETSTELRVTMKGIQTEVQIVSEGMKNISSKFEENRVSIETVGNLEKRITALEIGNKETFDRVFKRIEGVDDKSKIDVSRLVVQYIGQFIIFMIAGAGSFVVAMWVYFNYISKLPIK